MSDTFASLAGMTAHRLLPALLLLAACTSTPPATEPEALAPAPAASAPPAAATAAPSLPRAKPGSLLGKVDRSKLNAQVRQGGKPINISHRCSFRNETGYKGSTQVDIANSEVRRLATSIEVPLASGYCNFDNAGFRQTARSPAIELRHADGCTVRIWDQGPQLTISYSACAARCSSPEVFKYIWPVLIDRPSGRCD